MYFYINGGEKNVQTLKLENNAGKPQVNNSK